MVPLTGAGSVALVERTTKYPDGAGDAAVKEPLTVLPLVAVKTKLVGCAVGVTQGVGATALP